MSKDQSKDILTCLKGHTGYFVKTWNSDPKYRIWYMGCTVCGVFWSGGKNE